MSTDGYLYETLSPLSAAASVSSPPTTPPPAPEPPGDNEDYLVLRNHIPISTISTTLPETDAPEFFSLDLANDGDDWRTPTPPLKRSRLATPVPDEEPKRSLEAGWFRANCRFKSPMLQLHKDNYLYETLSPLSATASVSSPPTTPPPVPETLGDNEDYLVLRNHIPISTASTPLLETAAPEFFSLDLANDGDDWRTPTPPLKRSRLATSLPDEEPKRSLEAGWFRANCRFKSPMLQLHKEILDFCDFLSPTAEEQVSRNAAVEGVSDVIKYIWPNCKVEVFGSFKTGLFLPSSDVDMVILESCIRTPQMGLYALSRALSQKGVAKKIQVIAKARVPIIKFVEKRSGISFDVSFDMENGPKAAEYIQDAISKWPPLRPLCLILKVFLQQRELNEVYSGGIGSYALLAMLIAMLRNSMASHAYAEHNLGVLLVTFFDMYGRKLNSSDVGVSCDGGTFFSKKSKGFLNANRRSLLSIQDPQDPDNDIGKNSFNYFQIKSAFGMACSTLTDNKLIMNLGPNRSILGTIIRPDKVLLERKGGLNGDVTFTNLLPGAGEPLQKDFGEHEGLYCNWSVDDQEEPLPRGNDEGVGNESGKKSKKAVKKKTVRVKKTVTIKKRKRPLADT